MFSCGKLALMSWVCGIVQVVLTRGSAESGGASALESKASPALSPCAAATQHQHAQPASSPQQDADMAAAPARANGNGMSGATTSRSSTAKAIRHLADAAPQSVWAQPGGLVAVREHPLRPYCEYLSFLFRRPDGPDGQEALELGYRDYLQVPAAHKNPLNE